MNRLALELVADANPLLRTLDAAQRNIDRFMASADSAGKSFGGILNPALDTFTSLAKGGAAAAGGLAGGFTAAAASAVLLTASAGSQIEALDQLSQKTGIALNSIQSWSVVMAENGFQADTLTGSMRTLSKQVVEARNPASQAANTFDELGISIMSIGSTESIIRAVADKFKDMPDGADKARAAVTLFGKSGLEMIPILNRGSAAFDESRRAAERFAAILGTHQVQALKSADDAMDRLGVATGSLRNQLGSLFAPAVDLGASVFAEAIGGIARLVQSADTALDTLAIRFSHVALSANELASVLFSKEALSGDAWKQALATIQSIDAEAARLIAKRRDLGTITIGGLDQNAHVIEAGLAQEALGKTILAQLIEKQKLLAAEQHAQEALGKVTLAIIQRETAERNASFAMQLEQADQVNSLQFQKPASTTLFDQHLEAVKNLMTLIPELTFQEASLLAVQNSNVAHQIIADNQKRLQVLGETSSRLALMADTEEAYAQHAAASYRQAGSVFGDVTTARLYAIDAIDARQAASTAALDAQLAQQEISAEAYYQRILQLDLQADAKRRGVAAQFPTFYEQQLQSLVNSNVFSLGQISSNFTSATAQWIVTGRGFEQFWQQLQVTILQAALNSIVQMAANFLLHQSFMQSAHEAMESAKTASTAAGEGARLAIVKASSVAISASMLTTLAAIVGIGTMALAVAQIVVAAISGVLLAAASAAAVIPGGQPLAGSLIAAATILSVAGTMFLVAGGAAIQGAAGTAIVAFTSAIPAMAEGGVALGPSLVGEAGPEAVIPLNDRGAAFMQAFFGAGGGSRQPIHTHVYLNGREMARAISDEQPGALRTMGAF